MKNQINSIFRIALVTLVTLGGVAVNASATEPVAKSAAKSNPYNAQLAQDAQLRFQLTFQNPDKQKLTIAIKD
ncbi:MAG: hypothetical protein QM669_09565, partial [Siphonobacter sp.]